MDSQRTTPYTVKEISDAVNLSEVHIRRLLAWGKLQGEKVGRDWIIPVDVAQSFIRERRARWEKF